MYTKRTVFSDKLNTIWKQLYMGCSGAFDGLLKIIHSVVDVIKR